MSYQPALLDKSMPNGRFIVMNLKTNIDKKDLRSCLLSLRANKFTIFGIGQRLLSELAIEVVDYHQFPQLDSAVEIPATHGDLFVFIRDHEAGKVVIRCLEIKNLLLKCFTLGLQVDGFKYLGDEESYGHDLTGYEDGTENPLDDEAKSAVVREDGSCFVALQQWQHDLNAFNLFSQERKDNTIGRRLSDNAELSDAPASSHVHRTDQASFTFEADILRRSLPWANAHGEGLMFMSFCENLDRFEIQMKRMAGLEDGITDALFSFSKVLNSAYFYCPGIVNGSNGVLKL